MPCAARWSTAVCTTCHAYCADTDIPELTRLARTIDSWHAVFLAYFDTGGVSNGPTEAVNLLLTPLIHGACG